MLNQHFAKGQFNSNCGCDRIHHIGYLVDDIKNSAFMFENLGFSRLGEIFTDSSREIYILFLDNNGYVIELIQPISTSSPVYGLRKRYRNSPYHICYETENIEMAISKLCNIGGSLFQPKQPAPAIQDCASVAFLMLPHIGMIELVEIKDVLSNNAESINF